MAEATYNSNLYFLLLLIIPSLLETVGAWKNYTVGDSLGWYDNTENSKIDYQKWATGKNFSLGDFLIFNTNTNHSVIQTYSFSTYKSCDYNNALDNDTVEWSSADPSNTATQPVTVSVPLLKEGMTYFFSGDYDGYQCKSGQHFKINVTHGQGLPENLKSPSEQAPAPDSADSGGDENVPDTAVSSNFDNPQQTDNHKESGALSLLQKTSHLELGLALMFSFFSFTLPKLLHVYFF